MMSLHLLLGWAWYDDLKLDDAQILDVLDVARNHGALAMIHAENADCIEWLTRRLEAAGRTAPRWHAHARPMLVEREATHRAIALSELVDVPILIVHVSGREAIEQIRWAGVSIAESLAMFNVPVKLKWPNDVLHEGRKLAGILIESATATHVPHDASWAVIGIGINVALSESMSAEIGRPVANIPWLAELDQDMLMATIASGLAEAMVQFEHEGLAAFTPRWNALHAYSGQAVMILDNGRLQHEGLAVGVDDIGRFVLDTPVGRTAIMAGDVSLRPKG